MRHRLPYLTPPVQRPLKPIRIRLEIHHGLVDAFSRCLHKGAVLHDLLVERLAGNEHKVRVFGAAFLDRGSDGVAGLLEDDVVVGRYGFRSFGGAVAEVDEPGERVCERVPVLGQLLRDAAAGLDRDVEDPDGGVGEVADGVDAVAAAGDDLHRHFAVVDFDSRYLVCSQVPVPRFHRLELLGQIDP